MESSTSRTACRSCFRGVSPVRGPYSLAASRQKRHQDAVSQRPWPSAGLQPGAAPLLRPRRPTPAPTPSRACGLVRRSLPVLRPGATLAMRRGRSRISSWTGICWSRR